jgi:hypothetical protein
MSLRSLRSCFLFTIPLPWGLLLTSLVNAVSLSSSGLSVKFNDIPYFVSPYSLGNVPLDQVSFEGSVSVGGFYPITVLDDSIDASDFSLLIERFTAQDDVFQPGFTQSTLKE